MTHQNLANEWGRCFVELMLGSVLKVGREESRKLKVVSEEEKWKTMR